MSVCRIFSCVVGSGCLLWPVQRSSIRVFANESSLPTGNPLQYSCLEIPWSEEPGGLLYIGSHRVGHNWSDSACMHTLEKEMATHSSILAWGILWTEEHGGLPSMWSHGVGHDWSDLAAAAAADVLSRGCLIVACQVPLTMEFSRQDYWNGLPFPSPDVPWATYIKLPCIISSI